MLLVAKGFDRLISGLIVAVAMVTAIRIGGGFWKEVLTGLVIVSLSYASLHLFRKVRR